MTDGDVIIRAFVCPHCGYDVWASGPKNAGWRDNWTCRSCGRNYVFEPGTGILYEESYIPKVTIRDMRYSEVRVRKEEESA